VHSPYIRIGADGTEGVARRSVVISWSSGKDSAFALGRALERPDLKVVGLLTTVTAQFGRVSMHGVREELLLRQASALGLPIERVEIPYPCPNAVYEDAMGRAVVRLRSQGVEAVVFGDIFLEDLRAYREAKLAATGLAAIFPLWKEDTRELADQIVRSGIEAYIVALDSNRLPRTFAGRRFDSDLLRDLPPDVDPCGERGEFHTFVADAPTFRHRVPVVPGPIVERDGFLFADLLPG
jgi:uncharacterized protein (TIGR00290 family)